MLMAPYRIQNNYGNINLDGVFNILIRYTLLKVNLIELICSPITNEKFQLMYSFYR